MTYFYSFERERGKERNTGGREEGWGTEGGIGRENLPSAEAEAHSHGSHTDCKDSHYDLNHVPHLEFMCHNAHPSEGQWDVISFDEIILQ